MTISEAYSYFLNIVEKNSTNNNLNIDKARFVEWFNFTSKRYQEYSLEKRNEDSIREMSSFLKEEKIPLIDKGGIHDIFQKPDDYFDFSNLRIAASKGKCEASDFILSEVKSENIHYLLNDINSKPSYKARESFYHFMSEGIAIYHNADFSIKDVFLKYYRQIPMVDIEGYIKLDGSQSTNIDPETEDKVTVKILQQMAVYFTAAEGDSNAFQMQNINKQ